MHDVQLPLFEEALADYERTAAQSPERPVRFMTSSSDPMQRLYTPADYSDEHYLENEVRIEYLLDTLRAGRAVSLPEVRDPAHNLPAQTRRLRAARRSGASRPLGICGKPVTSGRS